MYFSNNGNLCNYADDNTLYSMGKSLNLVKENLKVNFLIMQKWFYENHMVLNPRKSYEKLLGILTDRDLNFGKHVKSLCRKAGQKLNALARINNYLTHDQKHLLLNSIIKSQFSYCWLIWMFCSRSLNNLINRIHKRALRLIHNDYVSTFQEILEMTKEKIIHQNNLECPAKEIYKFLNCLLPPIINGAFMIRNNNYNLRNFHCRYSTNKRTVKYGTETVTYRGPQIWNLISKITKNASSFDIFKKKIGKRKGEKCPCRICKTYIQHVRFI